MTSLVSKAWTSAPSSIPSPAAVVGASFGGKFLPVPPRFKSYGALSASLDNGAASAGESETLDRAQLAFSRAKTYQKSKKSVPPTPQASSEKLSGESGVGIPNRNVSETEIPIAVKVAMEKAKEYTKNKEVSSVKPINQGGEVILRNLHKMDVLNISSKDFLGLDFSEKKSGRGNSPGLVTQMAPVFEGDELEVEIIVGDASKFERTTTQPSTSSEAVHSAGLYKPKVSTWGVFPRPNNISKTFGGGRVINFGENLETPETKVAKVKRSRELISAYKSKLGLTIDAQTRAKCEKALAEGDSLMDVGKLSEALPYYENIMKTLIFQTELHGLAALQWSVCQDSLNRTNEAKGMYEKLTSHSNAEVRKKAKQFMFSFQAMQMMNVKDTSFPAKTGFEGYFEAFVDEKAGYTPLVEGQKESLLEQAFPFLIFLLSPFAFILLIAIQKSL